MEFFWSILNKIQSRMKILGAISLIGMCAVTCADVLLRAAFNTPIYGSEEIVTIFAVMAIAFAIPYSHIMDVHIGVEIVVRKLSEKTRNGIEFITRLCSLGLMAIITWRLFHYAGTMACSGELSMNLELPMYYLIHILAFSFFIFSLLIFKDLILFFKRS